MRLKRTLFAIATAFVLTLSLSTLWSAEGDERDGDTESNIVAASDAAVGTSAEAPAKKKSGRMGRFFKAPFKAVGRLFGGGSKEGKLERMTERDAERFESAGVMRVEDGRHPAERSVQGEGVFAASLTARDLVEEGRTALDEGRLNEAIAALSRAASLDPRLSRAHSLLAVAYDRKGLHERAREAHERAYKIDEGDAQALNNLGYSLYLNGNYRAAVERLKRAARLAPNDERILNNLALAQMRLGKHDDAYRSFARAGGEFNAHTNVASLLERAGRDEAALAHYEAAHRLQPASTTVLRRLADLYQRTDRPAQAAETRRRLSESELQVVSRQ